MPGGAVLVTGGAGYIGGHVLRALSEAGWRPIAFDNLSLGFREAAGGSSLVEGDVRDVAALVAVMRQFEVDAVVHLAGLIEVGRSVFHPDLFWDHNVGGTAAVLAAMRACGVGHLVFSSSAAVYASKPGRFELLTEDDPVDPASPYGDTKFAAEKMISASCAAFGLSAVALRYFNAAGAHPSGDIGEAHDPETHLIPLAIDAALGKRPPLTVFGDDFDTADGSCVRDYVHVVDLASAHVAALQIGLPAGGFEAINIGTGQGSSVLEVIDVVERVLGRPAPRAIGPRRGGDSAFLVADGSRAARRLGWRPTSSSIETIVSSAAAWHRGPSYGPGAR